PWEAKFLPGVVGLGASLLLVWGILLRWRSGLGAGWAWKTMLIALGCIGLVYWHRTLFEGRPVYAQTLFWLVNGGVLLGVAALRSPSLSVPTHDKHLAHFLRFWLLFALVVAVWGVPFQAMRHLLYALPPLILLLLPAVGKRPYLLLAQGGLSLLVLAADLNYALCYKRAADDFARQFRGERVWYAGSWGWMFYAEQHGFRKLLPDGAGLQPGDVILVPQRVYKGRMPPAFDQNVRLIDERVCHAWLPLRTMDFEGAAYYAVIRTNAPFRLTLDTATPLEVIRTYRWTPQR
ncbi:MAG: hypothetical protein NZL85_00665, partial [Fimbriimonadales bacterium]|nr:hypothetical protein [Fimbriimonadales bacterium]